MSVEFIKDTHTYLVDGIVTPSVSTILRATIFADKYRDVPEHVLQNAAFFGTAIHHAVEHDSDMLLDDEQVKVFDRWKRLQKTHNIVPLKQEQVVHYGLDYAGTFDMIGSIDGNEALIDIKTTYNLDKEYLSWQLSMYAYAYGFDGDLYAVWLPKRKGAKLVKIERKEEHEIKELLEAYYVLQRHEDELDIQW